MDIICLARNRRFTLQTKALVHDTVAGTWSKVKPVLIDRSYLAFVELVNVIDGIFGPVLPNKQVTSLERICYIYWNVQEGLSMSMEEC